MAGETTKIKRGQLYTGSNRELSMLSSAIETALRNTEEIVDVLFTRLLRGATVVGNITASKRIGSYYVDLRVQAIRILLPADPYQGERHMFKDIYGQAATRNLILDGGSELIEQIGSPTTRAATVTVNTNGACLVLEYNGDFWSIVYR